MKKNIPNNDTKIGSTNIMYNFTCPLPHVEQCIGMTQNCLAKRLAQYLRHGSILEHFKN